MGNSKSLYSNESKLCYFIQRSDYIMVRDLISQNPQLLEKPIAKDYNNTPLMKASNKGDLQMVKLLVQKGANINTVNQNGETAFISSIKRNHTKIIYYYLEKGVNLNMKTLIGLSTIDYAILPGYYQICLAIYQKLEDKSLQNPLQYYKIAKQYLYRYVNYQMLIQGILKGTKLQNMGQFLKKDKKIYSDPVIDPRESWKDWVKRVSQFKEAPLVERNQLPQNLQPQNRFLGKLHHYMHNFTSNKKSQKAILYPPQKPLTQINQILPESGSHMYQKQKCYSEKL